MSSTAITYKRNGVTVTMPGGFHGVCRVTATPYQYPKGHPCRGCPYTLNTTVPSCMFPERRDGGYDFDFEAEFMRDADYEIGG